MKPTVLRLSRKRCLAARGHKAGFNDFPTSALQTGCGEIGPNPIRTFYGSCSKIQPVCLGKRSSLSRFDLGSKAGQGYDGGSKEGEDKEGCERSDHLGAADCCLDPSTLGDQSDNNHREKSFHFHNLNLWPGHVSRMQAPGRCLRRASFLNNGNFGNFGSV
jgi:hypothetical protein